VRRDPNKPSRPQLVPLPRPDGEVDAHRQRAVERTNTRRLHSNAGDVYQRTTGRRDSWRPNRRRVCGLLGLLLALGCATHQPQRAWRATHLVAGAFFSCALRPSGNVYCWGLNGFGLPPAPTAIPGVSNAVHIAASHSTACAVLASGTVSCWGHSLPEPDGRPSTPLGSGPVELEGVTDVLRIAVGEREMCMLRKHPRGVECGKITHAGTIHLQAVPRGEDLVQLFLPPGHAMHVVHPLRNGESHLLLTRCALWPSGRASCWASDNTEYTRARPLEPHEQTPGWVDLPFRDVQQVQIGRTHLCVLEGGGAVSCVGDVAQLFPKAEILRTPSDADPGEDPFGTFKRPFEDAIALSSLEQWGCVVHRDGSASCWRVEFPGNMGVCPTAPHKRFTLQHQPQLAGLTEVAAGVDHYCALSGDGEVYCWGNNGWGQLGVRADADYARWSEPVRVAFPAD